VILLDTKREICEQRARQLSEEEAERTQNTLSSFELRWKTFFDELDPLEMFFEKQMQLEILEMVVDEQAKTNVDDALIKRYIEREKKPFNFHPTKKEIELAYKKQVAEKVSSVSCIFLSSIKRYLTSNYITLKNRSLKKGSARCILGSTTT
jgi:hypothetical protein